MKTVEQSLWAVSVMTRLNDAIYPFTLFNDDENFDKNLNNQLNLFLKKRPPLTNTRLSDMRKAIYFFETSQFDLIISVLGYDTEFVKRTFNLIQKYITARKKLYGEDQNVR